MKLQQEIESLAARLEAEGQSLASTVFFAFKATAKAPAPIHPLPPASLPTLRSRIQEIWPMFFDSWRGEKAVPADQTTDMDLLRYPAFGGSSVAFAWSINAQESTLFQLSAAFEDVRHDSALPPVQMLGREDQVEFSGLVDWVRRIREIAWTLIYIKNRIAATSGASPWQCSLEFTWLNLGGRRLQNLGDSVNRAPILNPYVFPAKFQWFREAQLTSSDDNGAILEIVADALPSLFGQIGFDVGAEVTREVARSAIERLGERVAA